MVRELSQKQKQQRMGYEKPQLAPIKRECWVTVDHQPQDAEQLDWSSWQKRPIVVRAVKMEQDFQVRTLEGLMNGKAGDYLVRGIHGELYPCDAGIFHKLYDQVTG